MPDALLDPELHVGPEGKIASANLRRCGFGTFPKERGLYCAVFH